MTELFSIKDAPPEFKVALLRELGFESDGSKIFDPQGQPVKDPYLGVEVTLDRMVLMPGSTIILDDNPASIAAYLVDNPDVE